MITDVIFTTSSLSDGNPTSYRNPGGTELLSIKLAEQFKANGLNTHFSELSEVSRIISNKNNKYLVFVQSQGRLNSRYLEESLKWITSGAFVIENNNFALASKFRPVHHNYLMLLSSRDSIFRYSYRSSFTKGANQQIVGLMPQPALHKSKKTNAKESHKDEITFLRIGRPDARKWTAFEIDFCRKLADEWSSKKINLFRIGFPGPERTLDIGNLSITDLNYVSDISTYLQLADIYLIESRIGETYGHSVAEALRSNLPVIIGAKLSWDCAHFELLDSGQIFGLPSYLLNNAKSTVFKALKTIPSHDLPGNTQISIDQYATQLLNLVSGNRNSKKEIVPPPFSIFNNLLYMKKLGLGYGFHNVIWAMIVEGARTIKNLRLQD